MEIYGIENRISYCEAKGLANCFLAYSENFSNEYIFEVGFNSNSGYTYIALENNITICSMLGREIEYLITDFDNGKEYFFNDYKEALDFLEKINN